MPTGEEQVRHQDLHGLLRISHAAERRSEGGMYVEARKHAARYETETTRQRGSGVYYHGFMVVQSTVRSRPYAMHGTPVRPCTLALEACAQRYGSKGHAACRCVETAALPVMLKLPLRSCSTAKGGLRGSCMLAGDGSLLAANHQVYWAGRMHAILQLLLYTPSPTAPQPARSTVGEDNR